MSHSSGQRADRDTYTLSLRARSRQCSSTAKITSSAATCPGKNKTTLRPEHKSSASSHRYLWGRGRRKTSHSVPDRLTRLPSFQPRAAPRSAQRRVGPRASPPRPERDRKSTRLNSSHVKISYAVFCLKK